jgi:hypothetical protein
MKQGNGQWKCAFGPLEVLICLVCFFFWVKGGEMNSLCRVDPKVVGPTRIGLSIGSILAKLTNLV